jgi:hypothetical protein
VSGVRLKVCLSLVSFAREKSFHERNFSHNVLSLKGQGTESILSDSS